MHYDDRLGTVLRLRADGRSIGRIQFRQLLDLLGTIPSEARSDQLDAAYARLSELCGTIRADERAAIVADPGLRLRAPRLVAALAALEPVVASAALRQADLSPEQWRDLIPALHPAARPALRERRDLAPEVAAVLARLGVMDRGLPPAEAVSIQAEVPLPAPAPPAPASTGQDGIGAIVKRIEAYRLAKQVIDHQPANDSPRLPLGEDHVLHVPAQVRAFDFATNAEGRLTWADPGIAAMVIGLRLGSPQAEGGDHLITALRRRQPLRNHALAVLGAEPIAGDWRLDALPWFDPLTGGYIGHRGRMRRPGGQEPLAAPTLPPVRDSEADRIRQMLHELRTPVNAIQGFAEIIQQQLFGPAPHDYRALAASIAGDAARMLSAFEELERLARLDSQAMELDPGETDLAAVVEATVGQLSAHTRQRGSGFDLKDEGSPLLVGLDRLEVERVIWRLLATLAGVSAPGEVLKARLRRRNGKVRLDIALPAALAAQQDEALFKAAAGSIPQIIAAGVFGVGFALRLTRAEARAAGGKLDRKDERLRLTLPGLTERSSDHTDVAGRLAGGS